MKFGAFFLLHSPDVQPSHVVYKRALDEMAYADALGFDSVWIAEHHFSNYGYSPNPLLLAVKAAAVTTRVRVGTAVLVLPFWHPLRLAEDVAMADVLTEGRLDVGIARGYQHYEFNRFGLDITHNRELSEETLQVLLKALNSIGITFEGDHYHIPETTTFPRSLQQPHPPLWLAASTQESFASAVKHGFNCFTSSSTRPLSIPQTAWKYFSQAREQMGATGPYEFAVQQHIHVATTDAEAKSRYEHSRWHYRHATALRLGNERVERGVATEVPHEGEPSLEEYWESHTLAGTPQRVREKLKVYEETIGLTQLNCIFNLGRLDADTVKSSMRLFAEQVMPHFK